MDLWDRELELQCPLEPGYLGFPPLGEFIARSA
jgi:hypothetical protein